MYREKQIYAKIASFVLINVSKYIPSQISNEVIYMVIDYITWNNIIIILRKELFISASVSLSLEDTLAN